MNIAFRLEASTRMGMGHLMRCLTLAIALKKKQVNCVFFVSTDISSFVAQTLRDFEIIELPLFTAENTDSVIFLENVKSHFDWVIVDHYLLSAAWEKDVSLALETNIFVIDDLANRNHYCEGLIDQSFFRKNEDYEKLLLKPAKLFLGKEYILLNESFSDRRALAVEKRKKMKVLNNVLISFGGVDSKNMALFSLSALNDFPHKLKIKVTVSVSHPMRAQLIEAARLSPHQVDVITDAANMADLILESDLCIGASGITSWERCFLGAPTIAIAVAENQKEIAEELAKLKCHFYLGYFNTVTKELLLEAVGLLHGDIELRKLFSFNSMNFLKESGVFKLANFLTDNELHDY